MLSPAIIALKHVAAVVASCNAAGYVATAAFEFHHITDLVGVGSFVVATATLSYKNGLITQVLNVKSLGALATLPAARLLLINAGVAVWGSRLATYLFTRVLQVDYCQLLSVLRQ